MAKIVLTYDGVSHDVEMSSLLVAEAEECEALTGWTGAEWQEALFSDRAIAVAFAWYLACKRAGEPQEFTTIRETFDLGKLSASFAEDAQPAVEPPAELGVTDDDDAPISPVEE